MPTVGVDALAHIHRLPPTSAQQCSCPDQHLSEVAGQLRRFVTNGESWVERQSVKQRILGLSEAAAVQPLEVSLHRVDGRQRLIQLPSLCSGCARWRFGLAQTPGPQSQLPPGAGEACMRSRVIRSDVGRSLKMGDCLAKLRLVIAPVNREGLLAFSTASRL